VVYQEKAKIVTNKKLTPSIYFLELDMPKIPRLLRPGQFLHIRIGSGVDPLLRRPFSVNRLRARKKGKGLYVGIVYKVVGKGTRLLKEMAVGEKVDVLGPLGNGFDINPAVRTNTPILLVCGGMGIAPVLFLSWHLMKYRAAITAFIGAETKKEIVCVSELIQLGCDVVIATDDGSYGYKGYVSQLLKNYLTKPQALIPKPYIYACGPKPMLKALDGIARKFRLQGQVSLDEMMGCGLGACLGCVIKVRGFSTTKKKPDIYKRICKDGPVFDITEIDWGK